MWLLSWRALCWFILSISLISMQFVQRRRRRRFLVHISLFCICFVFRLFISFFFTFLRSAWVWVTAVMVYLLSIRARMISCSSAFTLRGFEFFVFSSLSLYFFLLSSVADGFLLVERTDVFFLSCCSILMTFQLKYHSLLVSVYLTTTNFCVHFFRAISNTLLFSWTLVITLMMQ